MRDVFAEFSNSCFEIWDASPLLVLTPMTLIHELSYFAKSKVISDDGFARLLQCFHDAGTLFHYLSRISCLIHIYPAGSPVTYGTSYHAIRRNFSARISD